MIVVTGGEGFIGKNLVVELMRRGYDDIIILDTKSTDINSIYIWLTEHANEIDVIFHLGAITDTTETDIHLFNEYNLHSSMFIWNLCTENKIPLIYASSAATYGNGELGFDDEIDIFDLTPLNNYGWSKQEFDEWIYYQRDEPPFWAGLKFFNVYGYGEGQKGKMASVIYQAYNQIKECGQIKLFKSHREGFNDGEQKRDFIYVDDIVDVCLWLYEKQPNSDIYNVGTGKARSFNDLAKAVFKSLGIPENIIYIDMPLNLKNGYQYFTQAKMDKLKSVGYCKNFHELEEGVEKYVNKLKYENC